MANDFSGNPNCVALWNFEDSPGFGVDSIGGNDLTVAGPDQDNTYYKQGSQSARFIDGNTDKFTLTDANQDAGFPWRYDDGASIEKSFTVCFWYRPTTFGNNHYLFNKYNVATASRVFAVMIEATTDVFKVNFGWNSGGAYDYYNHGSALTLNRWYHVALSYNHPTETYKIRVWDDTAGSILGTDKTGTLDHTIDACDVDLAIGTRVDADSGPCDGYMDELVVFNTALTIDETDDIRKGEYPTVLTSGVSDSDSVSLKGWQYYKIDSSADDVLITVDLTGLTADGDLYLRKNAFPTTSTYDDSSTAGGTSSEQCELPNTEAATWYIGIFGYAASDFTVEATLTSGEEFEEFPDDSISLADSAIKSVGIPRADSVGMSDGFAQVYHKYLSDTMNLSDQYGDVSAFARTFPDTVNLSDLPTKSFSKGLSDTVNLSDQYNRVISWVRGLADTIDLSEGFGKANIFNRGLGDTINLSDMAVKAFGLNKTDAINLSDGLGKVIAYLRTFPDTIALSDEAIKNIGLSKVDTVTLTDEIVSMVRSLLLALNDTINLTDEYGSVSTFAKSLSDTIDLSDLTVKTIGIPLTDTVSLSDEITSMVRALLLAINDSIALSDGFGKVTAFDRGLSDTINLSDLAAKALSLVKSDSVSLSDFYASALVYIRSLSDTVTLSDEAIKDFGLNKADTVSLADSIVKVAGLNKSDAVSLADAIVKDTNIGFSDTINLSDAITDMIRSLMLALNDSIALSDGFNKATAFNRDLSDTVNLSDSILKSFARSLSDIVNLTDSAVKSIGLYKSDSVSLLDVIVKNTELSKADVISLTDVILKSVGVNRADSVTLSDEVVSMILAVAGELTLNLSDTIALADNLTKSVSYVKAFEDTFALSDFMSTINVMGANIVHAQSIERTIYAQLRDRTITSSERDS